LSEPYERNFAAQFEAVLWTTKHFLSVFGMETLRDLPDLERLEDAGAAQPPGARRGGVAEPGSDDDDQD
jgi:hypothetical protein